MISRVVTAWSSSLLTQRVLGRLGRWWRQLFRRRCVSLIGIYINQMKQIQVKTTVNTRTLDDI